MTPVVVSSVTPLISWRRVEYHVASVFSLALIELNSEELSQLVSLGGWLRGTEALTAVVEKQYTKDGAELLHQPILLDYFERRLANMRPKMKLNPLVIKVQKGVLEIRPFMGLPDGGAISEKSVKAIGTVSADLVKAINSKSQN